MGRRDDPGRRRVLRRRGARPLVLRDPRPRRGARRAGRPTTSSTCSSRAGPRWPAAFLRGRAGRPRCVGYLAPTLLGRRASAGGRPRDRDHRPMRCDCTCHRIGRDVVGDDVRISRTASRVHGPSTDPRKEDAECSPGSSRSSARSSRSSSWPTSARLRVARPARHLRRRARRLHRGQRRLPHGRRRSTTGRFTADVMAETLRPHRPSARSQPATRSTSSAPCAVDARLGGHIVQGHVDGTGTILAARRRASTGRSCASRPARRARPLRRREGLDHRRRRLAHRRRALGDADWFSVSLIPTTLRAHHARAAKQPGDPVNLEVDVIAKYVERMLVAGGDLDDREPRLYRGRVTRAVRLDPDRARPIADASRAGPPRSSSSTTRTARTRAT